MITNYIFDLQKEFFEVRESMCNKKTRKINVFTTQIKEMDLALDYIGMLCYGKKYLNENKNIMNDNGYICSGYFGEIK